MLSHQDATDDTDRRIAEKVASATGNPLEILRYTRDAKAAGQLRDLMQKPTDVSAVKGVKMNGEPGFIYACRDQNGMPVAQGIGPTPELAICDAFLHHNLRDPSSTIF